MRMSSDRLPKQVLYSQLSSGHRKRRRPRLRFKDTNKRNLKLRDIKIDSWTSLSQQRDKWRATVNRWKQCLSHPDRQHDDTSYGILNEVFIETKRKNIRYLHKLRIIIYLHKLQNY